MWSLQVHQCQPEGRAEELQQQQPQDWQVYPVEGGVNGLSAGEQDVGTHIEQVFHCTLRIVETRSQGSHYLLPLEAHLNHILN